jgi:uncharacterized membrane protein YcaP (DUF421 family)
VFIHALADSASSDMFHLALPVMEKIARPVFVYFFLIVGLRIAGKRELAQLNPFDLVVLLSLSNTVQNAIIGDDTSVTGGLIGALALFTMNYLVIRFLFKHRRLDQMIEGSPTVLIEDGRIIPRNLARELLNESELLNVLHRQGFATLDEVDRCELEPGGTFSVVGKEPRMAERHHRQLIERLDHLGRQVHELKELLATRDSDG